MGDRWCPELRNKRCVWEVNPKGTRKESDKDHFAIFPQALIWDMIKAGCPKDGIVLDPFFGSGTTGIVSLKQGKHFVGIELNPSYISIAKKRLEPYINQSKLQ